jgi:putative MATE family efflux protein
MEPVKETNKMGVVPVKKLMVSMGLPMVLSMILQAVYNIVDSAFVSHMPDYGEEALNALTLAFPLQMLMVAIGIGTGVGVNALISKNLGQGNVRHASRAAGNAQFLAAVITVAFVLFGLFGVDFYIHSQTTDARVAEMAMDYLRICCVFSCGIVFFSVFEKTLQACGHALYSTIAQITGAVTNMLLDPILIYGWLGLPELGVTGAAYATVIGQMVSCGIALFFHCHANRCITHRIRDWKPSLSIIREIYAIGLPAILAQALLSVMTYGLNMVLIGIGASMVTAYGLYYKIQQFLLFAAFGLRDAITPIVSFNYGMGSKKRMREGMWYGMLYTLIIMLLGLVAIECFAVPFAQLFGLSGETETLCVEAMHLISLSFLFAGANIAFQGIFQALGGGLESLVVSVCRQLVLLFPFVLLFAHFVQSGAAPAWSIWCAFPIAEGLSCLVAGVLFLRLYRHKVSGNAFATQSVLRNAAQ